MASLCRRKSPGCALPFGKKTIFLAAIGCKVMDHEVTTDRAGLHIFDRRGFLTAGPAQTLLRLLSASLTHPIHPAKAVPDRPDDEDCEDDFRNTKPQHFSVFVPNPTLKAKPVPPQAFFNRRQDTVGERPAVAASDHSGAQGPPPPPRLTTADSAQLDPLAEFRPHDRA